MSERWTLRDEPHEIDPVMAGGREAQQALNEAAVAYDALLRRIEEIAVELEGRADRININGEPPSRADAYREAASLIRTTLGSSDE